MKKLILPIIALCILAGGIWLYRLYEDMDAMGKKNYFVDADTGVPAEKTKDCAFSFPLLKNGDCIPLNK